MYFMKQDNKYPVLIIKDIYYPVNGFGKYF